eukprot:2693390-Amphidinium_carterae.1
MSLTAHFALSRFYFRTRSLRRGGATHHFVQTQSERQLFQTGAERLAARLRASFGGRGTSAQLSF